MYSLISLPQIENLIVTFTSTLKSFFWSSFTSTPCFDKTETLKKKTFVKQDIGWQYYLFSWSQLLFYWNHQHLYLMALKRETDHPWVCHKCRDSVKKKKKLTLKYNITGGNRHDNCVYTEMKNTVGWRKMAGEA